MNPLISVPVRVRFYDVDLTGTVFFTNHLKWFDAVAFPEFCKKAGMDWPSLVQQGIDVAMVHLSFDYKAPLFLDDVIQVSLTGISLGQSSMEINGAIHREDTLIGTGRIIYAFVDFNSRKSIPVPQAVREKVEAAKTFTRK